MIQGGVAAITIGSRHCHNIAQEEEIHKLL
jgi:hypothetical protein